MISLNNTLNYLDNETYSSDSEEDEYIPYRLQVINGFDDDSNIQFNDGYESDTNDTLKKEIEIDKQYSLIELAKAKVIICKKAKIDPNNVEKEIANRIVLECERYQKKNTRVNKLIQKQIEHTYESKLTVINDSDNAYECDWDIEKLPHKGYIDTSKTYSENEIATMRAHKYYKLVNLFKSEFYFKFDKIARIHNYYKIVFAFKNDLTVDDNQTIFMLNDIMSNKCDNWDSNAKDNLMLLIGQKVFGDKYDKDLLRTKWCRIQKLVKEYHPNEYTNWIKEYEAIERKAKVVATNLAEKEKHSVYRFLNQYKESGQIKVSVFYEQYVKFCSNIDGQLTNIAFGRLLNKYGLVTKQTKKDRKCYLITLETIQLWKTNFII